ncbi:hypothetical protein HYT59_02035 [Candidatus Woesebacteria bacterium]|nr:hypothetical protein [Candidatus Woesebacteria bacterium]
MSVIDILLNNIWLALGVWNVASILRHFLIKQLYKKYQTSRAVINKQLVKDPNNKNFVIRSVWASVWIFILWYITFKVGLPNDLLALLIRWWELILGLAIITEISSLFTSIIGLLFIQYTKKTKIEVSFKKGAVNMVLLSVISLLLFFFTSKLFFLGGSIGNLISAIRSWFHKPKSKKTDPKTPRGLLKYLKSKLAKIIILTIVIVLLFGLFYGSIATFYFFKEGLFESQLKSQPHSLAEKLWLSFSVSIIFPLLATGGMVLVTFPSVAPLALVSITLFFVTKYFLD